MINSGNTKGGRTVDLLFDWFGLVCFAIKNKNCQLSNSWFQTSQTGGQQYNNTSPFSITWLSPYQLGGARLVLVGSQRFVQVLEY
jgi:hypothetical protein